MKDRFTNISFRFTLPNVPILYSLRQAGLSTDITR